MREADRTRTYLRLLALVTLLSGLMGGSALAQAPLRVMSFNIRLPVESDGPNSWEHRRDLAAQTIRDADPDIIGTQELFKRQGDDLIARLPLYNWIGIDRRGGHADEHMGLFYRRDRLRLVSFENFWLSNTPDVPGSVSWDHPYPRMVTWGLFERKTGGKRFYAFDTHFPYRAEDEPARTKAATLLAAKIAQIAGSLPVVLTGDFNTIPDSVAHEILTDSLTDVWQSNATRSGPENTFHGFTGKADRRIDWILTHGFKPFAVRTIAEPTGTRQASDHFPVLAELRFGS